MFGFHYRLERKAIGLVLAIIGVASIGGLVEIETLSPLNRPRRYANFQIEGGKSAKGRDQHMQELIAAYLPRASGF